MNMTTDELVAVVDDLAATRPDLLDNLRRRRSYAAVWAVAGAIEKIERDRRLAAIGALLDRLVEASLIEAGHEDPLVDAALIDVYAHALEEVTR